MKTIIIKNTKGIKNLNFELPDKNGVYLIVGSNGAGKTTLLVCLDRICNPYAFARGFSCPKSTSGFDEYSDSQITYQNNNMSVVYRKKKSKWTASPRKNNAQLLQTFGFTNSIFIRADSKRIDATQDEIKNGIILAASSNIKKYMNDIFDTTRFNNLKKLKVTHGRGKSASFFNVIKDGAICYTEKRFSTGELAILHLLQSIENSTSGSIVLLDEAEIALHPRVQINLLKCLQQISTSRDLMVLISTHSPTLIKATTPTNILMLEPDECGDVSVVNPCYPTRALGGIDYTESAGFDYVFFVEDDMARLFLKKIINRYIKIAIEHSTASTSIIPVGGFYETAHMAVQTKEQLLNKSKVYAFVDTDAFENLEQKPKFKELYNANNNTIRDLKITPETYFVNALNSNNNVIIQKFKSIFHCEPANIVNSKKYQDCNSTKDRQLAKDRFSVFIKYCSSHSGDNEQIVTNTLIDIIVNSYPDSEIKQLLGPVFNK